MLTNWPSYYPNYFSEKGWELEKLDAKIAILSDMVDKHTKNRNTLKGLEYLTLHMQATTERSILLNQFSK